jgi:hypothetical protein
LLQGNGSLDEEMNVLYMMKYEMNEEGERRLPWKRGRGD